MITRAAAASPAAAAAVAGRGRNGTEGGGSCSADLSDAALAGLSMHGRRAAESRDAASEVTTKADADVKRKKQRRAVLIVNDEPSKAGRCSCKLGFGTF
jgi:hypothetical protein